MAMTVEEQMLMKSLAAECERLHKELEKHRWIPVSERIPEDGRYLFSLPDRGGTIMCGDVMFGKFFSDDYEQTSDDVIAWMPLPEPYQKGEQE